MNLQRSVKDAYDEIAAEYFEEYTAEAREKTLPEPIARFCESFGPEDRVLSAGCGPGDNPLVTAGESGVGLDISREQLRLVRKTTPAIPVQGDMTALPFAANSFNAVAAIHSLIHVPLADHRAVIEEFERVLRPDGTLLVSEGGLEWSGSNPDWLDSGTEMRWSMAGPETTRADLEACGFEIQGVWDVQDPINEDGQKPFFLATAGSDRS